MEHNSLIKPLIPDAIMRSGKQIKASFLRGLFATDGSVGRAFGSVSFSTKHRGLADQVRFILRCDFGFESCLTVVERGKPGDYICDGVQYVVSVRGSRAKFADIIGFSYKYKQEALDAHRGVKGRRKFVKVVSIEHGDADVYDLEVADDPSYVANGFISHNSADTLQQFRGRGINAEVQSIDKTVIPYDLVKTAMYEGRIALQANSWVVLELQQLMKVPKPRAKGYKIDHPRIGKDGNPGTKDVADCLAGVVYSLTQREPGRPIPMTTSAPAPTAEEVNDHSWVTDGLRMVKVEAPQTNRAAPRQNRGMGGESLPFVRG